MNTKQMQYAVQLSETGSFSALADKLKITQPALSKQILSLEKELGVELFDRTKNPIVPTAAGAHFVRQAKKLLYSQSQLLRSMEQFRTGEKSHLTIGATPFRSAYLLPGLLQKLRTEFPGVQITVVEEGSALVRKDAVDGRFDLAIVNLPVDEAALEAHPIEPDSLAAVIPTELLPEQLRDAEETDFSALAHLPFVVVSAGQEMRILFENLCASNDVQPEIAAQVVGLTTAWDMACAGVGATLLPLQFLQTRSSHRVTVIPLAGDSRLRHLAVVTKRGQYLSPCAQAAIALLTHKAP